MTIRCREASFALLWAACLSWQGLGRCQALNERVLVVYNGAAAESLSVARHYLIQRQIPQNNLCRISVTALEYVNQEEFEARVKAPIRKCIEAVGKDKVLYVVFSYQTPYVVTIQGRVFALDSFVADIWDEYSGSRPGNEVGKHPYFGEAQSQGNAYEPFVPLATYRSQARSANIYSVWRLDAANSNLAKGLVDKAIFAEAHGLSGKGCFDLQSQVEGLADYGPTSGDFDIHQAAELARHAGFEVVEDTTPAEFGTSPAPAHCDGAALYAGWYSLGHYNDAFTWNPGAIGFHLDSASATNPRGGGNWSASAVMKGITITSGAAAEPYLEGMAHPDQVFRYLLQGANAGDAFLRGTRWLKWMILNIGDPLYRPFPKGATPFNLPGGQETIFALLPQTLVGGNAGSGIVVLSNPAPEGATIVTLKSERPEIVSVPKTLTIPAKAASARFSIITHTTNQVAAARISMTAGDTHRFNTLVVYPCMQPVMLSQTKVRGGAAVTGTVTLTERAPAQGVIVKLSGDHTAQAHMPAEILIPAGTTQSTFHVTTLPATTETTVVITVSVGTCTGTSSLTVIP